MSRPTSTGPRLHNYTILPTSGGVTHVRPGVVSVSTGTSPAPTPAPVTMDTYRESTALVGSVGSVGMARAMSVSSDRYDSPGISLPASTSFSRSYDTGGSWSSLARGAQISGAPSLSRSASTPKSDEGVEVGVGEGEYVEVDI